MTAQIIDGKALAQDIRQQIRQQVAQLGPQAVPGLAVILVGDDPASQIYVRHKVRACEEVGMRSIAQRHPADLAESQLLEHLDTLNRDPAIHGILVQLPLPAHISAERVIDAIAPEKDVDGFHPVNAGALLGGRPGLRPCTPLGCMRMLASIGLTDLGGRSAVVIGRSNIVGKPMALLLLAANATVTICHSATPNLAQVTRQADILVAAAGRAGMVSGNMVKPGAVVIDVGINRGADGKLCGDVDFAAVREVAGAITPVPGGVGPMTIAMLLANTLDAARRSAA
ncbi:MAG: bifunctional methylenetetrahydrofolate dehydrogenase/methenyltetrahydrofolate cyclohydrolase FolD [Ottowia sp.]|nr:bifunctional methylenetetrahydrofolate dehydrogenase/methenyltetrahydrofolate cyclohydrolase FolD [Ottowia sp.]